MKILTQSSDTPVIQKTRELCQTILDQPAYQQLRKSIDEFIGHADSVSQYRQLCEMQDALGSKQEQNIPLPDDEVAEFERLEQAFLANPLAQSFIAAQRQLQQIEQTVSGYVRKTFELGRVPAESDLSGGGCCGGSSGGCGCH